MTVNLFSTQVIVNGKTVHHACTANPCECVKDSMPVIVLPFGDLLTGAAYIRTIMPRDWMFHCVNTAIQTAVLIQSKSHSGHLSAHIKAAKGAQEQLLLAFCLVYADADLTSWLYPHRLENAPQMRKALRIDGRAVREARVVVTGMPKSVKLAKKVLDMRAGEWERFYSMDGTWTKKK